MSEKRDPHCFRFRIIAFLSWILLSWNTACNVGGYPDLGSRLDTVISIGDRGATAWMRTDNEGANDILVLGEAKDSGRFALMHIKPDSTGTLRAGTYSLEDTRITLYVESAYRKENQLDVPPSGRDGSIREDFDPPTVLPCTADMEDGKLHITLDGEPTVMTDFWDVIEALDPDTQTGVNMLSRFFNLSTVSLQMRIPGFGGAGLLQYAGEPSSFVGVVGGAASIEMTSVLNPTAKILFDTYRDYPGNTLDGDQVSTTDMAGDGQLSGTMHVSMKDPRPDGEFDITFDLTYKLTLRNGTSADGGYDIVMSTGTTWFVPYQEGETLDFRSVLPPS